MITQEDRLEQWAHELNELAVECASLKGLLCNLDESKKSVLAVQMRKAEASGFTSVAAQDREARTTPEYGQHIEALSEATTAYESARLRYANKVLEIEIWRTLESSKRAEMVHR